MQNTKDSTKGAILMSLDSDLGFWANIHAIGGFWVAFTGACVGIYGYCSYRCSWNNKTKALVDYLKSKKDLATDGKEGQHTTKHLIRYVGLTEDEILKISFENEHVHRTVNTDKDGKADTLFFEYKK